MRQSGSAHRLLPSCRKQGPAEHDFLVPWLDPQFVLQSLSCADFDLQCIDGLVQW